MKILAIDPGYERLGIAILEKESSSKEVLIHSECFQTSKDLDHASRLSNILERIKEIVDEYEPYFLAIESLFFSKNKKTALNVSEVRGSIISYCKNSGLEIKEFMPNQIKVAITGDGRSDKKAIMKIVPLLIKVDQSKIKYDDEYDAIAVGLTFFATFNTFNRN